MSDRARPRQTQRERSEATTGELLDAARELFARDGYAATSLEAVCAAAGVTKGALYHHFPGKRELFRAVYQAEQQRLGALVAAAYEAEADPWDAFHAGCRAFLHATRDPGVARVTFLDGPVVFDADTLRELEAGSYGRLAAGVRRAMKAGRLPERPVEPLARLLFGAVCEAARTVARSPDPEAAAERMLAELRTLLDSLATRPGGTARRARLAAAGVRRRRPPSG